MIVDLNRFVETGRPRWQRLEQLLDWLQNDPLARPSLAEVEELHGLYQRACSDLAKVAPLVSEPELKLYLEHLVGRAYCEIHETRGRRTFAFRRWFFQTFPQTVRRHWGALQMSTALFVLGSVFGTIALSIDPDAKSVLMPFSGLMESPAERVAREIETRGEHLAGSKTRFSAQLMTNNTRVTLFALALGITFGIGTILILFYNGIILGAVAFDYVTGGQGVFLLGWLLPHGSVEIPAILLGGQAGLVLGHAMVGWGERRRRWERLRAVGPDLVTLVGGAAVMLVWAGIVEAFFSQYHEPVVPYAVKIAFGTAELGLVIAFFRFAGRRDVRT